MCGICGAVGFSEGNEIVKRMNCAMQHRGPDSDGLLSNPDFCLGVRRLKIIDLETGDQPLYNEGRNIAVIQNGEIYNYRALRSELISLGHHFTSYSDTEVIIHAYEQWGLDSLPRLQGMFAFALFDQRQAGEERLILVRDRLGIKPLYIWRENGHLLFASEVRALLASGIIKRQVSPAGLKSYLAFGSPQEPLTLIEGVRSLEPASWMSVQLVSGRIKTNQGYYWQPPAQTIGTAMPAEVHDWILDAVSSHLVSDVPLGAFLSGGLDSGAIVSLGSQALQRDGAGGISAFTMSFPDWPLDERELAQATANRSGARHTVRVVEQAEFIADLPQALAAMDQPTVDGVNSWFVSREARRAGLTVALSGVGGDELFAGYPSFRQAPRLGQVRRWPGRRLIARGLPGSPDGRRKLQAYLAGDPLYPHAYFAVRGLLTSGQIKKLLLPAVWENAQESEDAAAWRSAVTQNLALIQGLDEIGQISWLELSQYMRSTLLRDTDMMSMAHSLEVRVPFVDHKLIEQVLPLPGSLKVNGRGPKPLLGRALQSDLSREIIIGSKRTFTFPFENWLRQGLSQEVGSRLEKPIALREWFGNASAAQIWQDFEAGHLGWARPWALYALDQWLSKTL